MTAPAACFYCTPRDEATLRAELAAAEREMIAAGARERFIVDRLLCGQAELSANYDDLREAILRHDAARRRYNRAQKLLESEAQTA